jgi:hypothetical protein
MPTAHPNHRVGRNHGIIRFTPKYSPGAGGLKFLIPHSSFLILSETSSLIWEKLCA